MESDFFSEMRKLEDFGERNDSLNLERSKRMLNITFATGEFLSSLIVASQAKNILEIGTSNGYSTLWIANTCAKLGGIVTTVEKSEIKIELARENFKKFNLEEYITLITGDASTTLASLPSAQVDLLFLDAERSEYLNLWVEIDRVLKPYGTLVVDNAISHREELSEFVLKVQSSGRYTCCLVPVGKGEFMAVKNPSPSFDR